MTETDALVVSLDGDDVWVRVDGSISACGVSSGKDGCKSSGMSSVPDGTLEQPARLLRLPNTIHAKPGDTVVVCVADGVVLGAVWLAYGIPLLLAMSGAIVVSALTDNQSAALAGALLGLALGLLFMLRSSFGSRGLDSARSEPIFSISLKRSPLIFHEV